MKKKSPRRRARRWYGREVSADTAMVAFEDVMAAAGREERAESPRSPALVSLRRQVERAEAEEARVTARVAHARSVGHSWAEIAEVFGLSRPAVQKRYDS